MKSSLRASTVLSVQLYADEHPPPHFHVCHAGESVAFSLDTGTRLPDMKGLKGFDKNVTRWWRNHQCELVAMWNRLRPTDCPVGPVPVPPRCRGTEEGDDGD